MSLLHFTGDKVRDRAEWVCKLTQEHTVKRNSEALGCPDNCSDPVWCPFKSGAFFTFNKSTEGMLLCDKRHEQARVVTRTLQLPQWNPTSWVLTYRTGICSHISAALEDQGQGSRDSSGEGLVCSLLTVPSLTEGAGTSLRCL
jgi:hypothetical protein